MEPGVPTPQLLVKLVDRRVGEGRQYADANLAADDPYFGSHLFEDLVSVLQQRVGLRQEALAHIGQGHAAAGPVEKPGAQLIFQRLQLSADHGLLNVQGDRSLSQAAVSGDLTEQFELAQVHTEVSF